jgi:hypothetical protein
MTTQATHQPNHLHFFNYHTGRPRFHFDEASDAAAASAAAAAAAKPWHDGVDPAVKGFWETKGLKLDNPRDFGVKLTEMYQGAERLIGVPPDRVVKLPAADAKPEDLRSFYERLGAPKEAKDYDLSTVKDTAIADALRAAAHTAGLPKTAAETVAKAVATALDSKATQQTTLDTAKLAEQKENLAKNWGDKFAYNHLQAIEGARRLGINPEGVKALEGLIGYDGVMEAMRKIGASTREDTFVERGAGGPAGDVVTLEGAKARKAELMADQAWGKRYLEGGAAERREMDRLNQMITGVVA